MRNTLLLVLMLLVIPATTWADAALDAYNRGEYATAVRLWELRAQAGEAKAQHSVGWMYANGQGVAKDYAQAMYWFRKAAAQQYKNAQYWLGWMYANGYEVAQDDKEAVSWYRKAAKQRVKEAQYLLGWMYANGRGIAQDDKEAVSWYRKAAKQRVKEAQYLLGWMYANGRGIAQDDKEAVSWYRKAAKQGVKEAQYLLGEMYASGRGITKDNKQAMRWYKKAAEQDNTDAIRKIQELLTKLGYEPGPFDGGYNHKTRTAVEQFLRDNTIVTKDTTPPQIQLQRDITLAKHASQTIRGQAIDESGVAIVSVNRQEAALDDKGFFSASVLLKPGKNQVVIKATDIYKNVASKMIVINREIRGVKPISKTDEITRGEYYALLIAVEDYQHDDITDLEHPVNDVKKIKQVLQQYNFKPQNITVLTNPTRGKIIKTFDKYSRQVSGQDNLLIFYAGHGHWDDKFEEGYWLPSDAWNQEDKSSWLSNSTLVTYIRGINTKHTLLISDACFSGGIFKERKAFSDAPRDIKVLYKAPSRTAMTSGALQTVPDRSVFIKHLIKHLQQNKNKYLPAQQLLHKIKSIIMNDSPAEAELNPQYGSIRQTGDEFGDFVFVRSGE